VPKVIAQHHCSPPPTPALMAAWLNALRKRHAKQYSVMQTELKEVQYYQERKEGYKESVQNDIVRKNQEKEEEAKRAAAEKADKEHQEAIAKRRTELKASLPEEATDKGAKKIAIRFADGRSGQRRFTGDQPLSTVFNWVDVMYEIEREKVILTTMNGKQTFTWDEVENEKSLDEAGLGRMTGFRVAEKKEEEEDKQEEPSEEESS
jgi:glutamate synthase domain-containing protein 2